MVEQGQIYSNGKLPIKPSYGFASFGEATTVIELFRVAEGVLQL
jgi:hypothetical protein